MSRLSHQLSVLTGAVHSWGPLRLHLSRTRLQFPVLSVVSLALVGVPTNSDLDSRAAPVRQPLAT